MTSARTKGLASCVVAIAVLALGCSSDDGDASGTTTTTTVAENTATQTAAPRSAVLSATCKGKLVASTPGKIANDQINELSGIVSSRRTNGVWWVNNDSGDSARLFAVGGNGRSLGEFRLSGAQAIDWEDIGIGPGPKAGVSYLYAADIGDNAKARPSVQLYRVPEPAVDPTKPASAPKTLTGVAKLTLTYPDTPHDAEAFFVDPKAGRLYIVSKELGAAGVYRAPAGLKAGSTTKLQRVGKVDVGPLVTAADITAPGDAIALRTYTSVRVFARTGSTTITAALAGKPCKGRTAAEPQGEAIGFTRDGRGYVTVSEGAHAPLHRFTAP
jgi:hypothetical protein